MTERIVCMILKLQKTEETFEIFCFKKAENVLKEWSKEEKYNIGFTHF